MMKQGFHQVTRFVQPSPLALFQRENRDPKKRKGLCGGMIRSRQRAAGS